MKRKRLIKSARDIPEDAIRQQVEAWGKRTENYFLLASGDGFLVCFWNSAGGQNAIMNDDDVNNFAVAQYLIRHGASVYQDIDEVPVRKETNP
jgi:hypothetical protein